MSIITTLDPIDRLLDAAQNGQSIIKNRDVLHFTYIPNQILHRDPEQEKITQSLLPILKSVTLGILHPHIFISLVNLGLHLSGLEDSTQKSVSLLCEM